MASTPTQFGLLDLATFKAHLSAQGDAPSWLLELKQEAWAHFEALPMPHAKMEAWRFANTSKLNLSEFGLAEFATTAPSQAPDSPSLLTNVGRIGFVDDREVAFSELPESLAAQGVIFMPLADALVQHGDLVREHLFSRLPDLGSKKFESLHAAYFSNGVFLYVPKGVVVDKPLVVEHWTGSVAGSASFPHTLVVAEDNSEVTLVDFYQSMDAETPHLVCGVTDVYAASGAHVNYRAIQNFNLVTTAFLLGAATAERDAALGSIGVHCGGSYIRNEQHCRILGAGAHVDVDSLALVKGTQQVDQRTLQTHAAPNGRSNLLYKNTILDNARTIFSGLIKVMPDAQKTDGYQSNRNLLLSDTAEANSLPGLEIEANDVRCTHGATSAQIDEDQLFYLQARGIPLRKAQEMLTFAFFEEVLEKFGNDELADYVRELLQYRFAK